MAPTPQRYDAVRPAPAIEAAPPVTPNLPRRREIPGARHVARNTFEVLFFRALSTPIALLLVVIQSRFLEPEGRGRFVLVVLSVSILARLFGQLGIAVTTYADGAELRPLVQRALGLTLALDAAGVAIILAAGVAVDAFGLRLALIAAPALIPNTLNACISGVLLGQARIRLWNYIQALPPLLTLIGMLIVVVGLGADVDGAVAVWAAAYYVTAAFTLIGARDLWWPTATRPLLDRHSRALLRLALVMGAVQIVNLVGYRIELFILELYEDLAAVGIYSIAMQAAEAMWLIPAAIATAVTGPVVHETDARAAHLIRRACARGVVYTAAVAIVVGLLAPLIIPPLLGEEFRSAWKPLALLLPGVVAYAPVSILVVYLSIRRERPRLSLLVSVVGLVVTTAASLFLIPAYGVSGAAHARAVGYAAGAAAAWERSSMGRSATPGRCGAWASRA